MFHNRRSARFSGIGASAKVKEAKTRLTVVVGVAKRPGLIGVKVRVSSDAGAGEVSVGQEAPLSVERGAVTVETRGEEDHDVSLFALVLDLRVRHLLRGIRGTNKESIFQKIKNTVSFTRSFRLPPQKRRPDFYCTPTDTYFI